MDLNYKLYRPDKPYHLKLVASLVLALVLLTACSTPNNQTGTAALPAETATREEIPSTSRETQPAAVEEAATPFAESEGAESTPPALACSSPAPLTPPMMEGPYYKADSPERNTLIEPGMPGTRLVLSGYVLTTDCQPVANAWIDFWQTDANGTYDNDGYKLRGNQHTDQQGRYWLETVMPGIYPGRTAHIHVKVQAPGGPVLTTQLFIPGEPGNQRDSIYSDQLLIQVQESGEEIEAVYNFIVEE